MTDGLTKQVQTFDMQTTQPVLVKTASKLKPTSKMLNSVGDPVDVGLAS